MIRTRVGYAGGTKSNPTYHALGDHTETLEIDYDPEVLSYDDLLTLFWEEHDPTRGSWSRQYMTAIFYRDKRQKEAATASLNRTSERLKREVKTRVLPLNRFYAAEDYHQKYRLRSVPELIRDYQAIYPDPKDLMDSTAAARVNGYVAGYGQMEQFRKEIGRLGLSPAGRRRLEQIADRRLD